MYQFYFKSILCFSVLIVSFSSLLAQNVTITPGGITPALSGTYPRLSYEGILALANPQEGDIAYDTIFKCLRVYIEGKWICSNQDLENFTPNASVFASAGSVNGDVGYSVVTDASGNVYVGGTYQNTITFGHISKTSSGSQDVFLVKYNNNGVVQWVQSGGGPSSDFLTDIAIDVSGNIYITGDYFNTAIFESTNIGSASTGNNIYVAKYNSAGNLLWVKSAGGTDVDFATSIAVDASGIAYITGSYKGSATFGGFNRTSAGSSDIYLAKYSSVGNVLSVHSIGGLQTDTGTGVATDAGGNVYLTGSFGGSFSFGGTDVESEGLSDSFFAKYNSNSVFQWVKTLGGDGDDIAQAIKVDAGGSIYVSGQFSGTCHFGSVLGSTRISQGSFDVFLVRYNTSGVIDWVKVAGGTSTEYLQDMEVDPSGNIYMTGYFVNTIIFEHISKTSKGNGDIFVAKYDAAAGDFQWLKVLGGKGNDVGRAVAAHTSGALYVTGSFTNTVTFGNAIKTSAGSSDMFLIRLDQ